MFDAVSCKSYRRTDKPELGRRCGFIAQDVQSACVSAGVPDTFTQDIPQDDGTTLLGLDYARLVCAAFSKIKQLEARIATLESR